MVLSSEAGLILAIAGKDVKTAPRRQPLRIRKRSQRKANRFFFCDFCGGCD
jgi:hypothetical protein